MSWRKVKLGELVEEYSVRAKNEIGTYDTIFYGVSNDDGITISKYAAEDKVEEYKIIEKGCFAYNPYRINVGSIALMNEDKRGLVSPAYVVFKPKPESIIPELLLKFLKSAEGLRQIKLYGRGTVRQALRFEDLCKIELSLPSFDEQKILFNKIDAVECENKEISTELSHQLSLIKQLRQAFLKEAMQGKLAAQNPDDEPASELLKKIKLEKEKLINEKKIKKEKDLPPIKPEEIPYEIPENWVWCRLGEVIKFTDTINIESKLPPTTKINYIDIDAIDNTKYKIRESKLKSVSELSSRARRILRKGYLVYSLVRPYLNNIAIVEEEKDNLIGSVKIFV